MHMTDTLQEADPLELAKALLANGDALLSDASYLLVGGRQLRSAALALMAVEEFSKIYPCLNAITGEAELPRATSKEWRDHRDKLETAKALDLAFIDPEPDFDLPTVSREVESQRQLKMACIYVDHCDGKVQRPDDVRVDAAALVANGQAKSRFLHTIIDRVTPEVVSAMSEHRQLMVEVLDQLVDETDPEGTVARLRALAAAAASDDIEAITAVFRAAVGAEKHDLY
jgi:AbiV family abortive infection protein